MFIKGLHKSVVVVEIRQVWLKYEIYHQHNNVVILNIKFNFVVIVCTYDNF